MQRQLSLINADIMLVNRRGGGVGGGGWELEGAVCRRETWPELMWVYIIIIMYVIFWIVSANRYPTHFIYLFILLLIF